MKTSILVISLQSIFVLLSLSYMVVAAVALWRISVLLKHKKKGLDEFFKQTDESCKQNEKAFQKLEQKAHAKIDK